jgi:hypothetical protein
VEYLGREVECQHCHARFDAFEPGTVSNRVSDSGLSLLERAELLLQSASMSMPIGVGAGFGSESVSMPTRPK